MEPIAAVVMTENAVRVAERIQNAVFITFVHSSIHHQKFSRFEQFHAEHALWALTYFKFRFLRGPIDHLLAHFALRETQGIPAVD